MLIVALLKYVYRTGDIMEGFRTIVLTLIFHSDHVYNLTNIVLLLSIKECHHEVVILNQSSLVMSNFWILSKVHFSIEMSKRSTRRLQ